MELTFGGNPIHLVGQMVKVGDQVTNNATVVTKDFSEAKLFDFTGDVTIVSLVPSLDTSVCDLQTKGFIAKLAETPSISLITVSMDLPFAQARWCGAADAMQATVVSDYRYHEVASAFGAMIEEFKLLTRAVFVLDANKVVQYVEYVAEGTDQVQFEAALEAAKALISQ